MNKETFISYETVRQSGLTNMFNTKKVCMLSNDKLTKEDCMDIMKNYEQYAEKWIE